MDALLLTQTVIVQEKVANPAKLAKKRLHVIGDDEDEEE